MPSPEPLTPMLVAELVGSIYEAALDARLWQLFVDRIESVYPEMTVALFSHETTVPSAALNVVANYSDAALRDYKAHHFSTSPYVDFVPRNQVGRPVRTEAIIRDEELYRTEHYNDFMRPHGIGRHGTGMVLEREAGGWASFSFADRWNDVARREHQMQMLHLLAPHFARAFKLRRTLMDMCSAGMASRTVFDGWMHAAFVLDREGRVMTMNRKAEALVARGEGVRLNRFGQPRSFDDKCSRALEDAFASCRAGADSPIEGAGDLSGVMLPRRVDGAALHAMVWPIASAAEFGLPSLPGQVLLVISDPDDTPPGAVAWIARRYGLSPAEEKLADAVIAGVPLNEAAEKLGIQLSTARTRLKTIQAKTGCHRQMDLVRLAMSVPTIRPV